MHNNILKLAQEYEAYVYEDDHSASYYEQHMDQWWKEFRNADWNDLWNEERKLKTMVNECEADDEAVPFIVKEKLKLLKNLMLNKGK